ncbi:hypothetical protein [Ensifer sp. ZNC0028]|uniref:hypothetical protein n=1 Tax=Ensifer sp. ZNC0028 TaxID=1339236 RepID=UPI000AB0A408|nr:hypothetical protein [Ensifer sp. ZNC0028]
MASAEQARRAYLKWGFVELGVTRFAKPVKADLAGMIVLAKQLDGASSFCPSHHS